MANFGSIIEWVLRLEDRTLRGIVKDLGDGAGLTRFGLTTKNCPGLPTTFWYTQGATPVMGNAEAIETAKNEYHANYWYPIRGSQITNDELAATLMSFAVNDGVQRAVKLVQGCLGLPQDGNLGPVTLGAILSNDSAILAAKLRDAQEDFYRAVVAAHPERAVYLDGWMKRAQVVYPDLP